MRNAPGAIAAELNLVVHLEGVAFLGKVFAVAWRGGGDRNTP